MFAVESKKVLVHGDFPQSGGKVYGMDSRFTP